MNKRSDVYFEPIKKEFHNTVYKGNGDEVKDLSVFKVDDGLYSNWKIKSIWQRLRILFSGEITIAVLSHSLPPMSVISGDWVKGN